MESDSDSNLSVKTRRSTYQPLTTLTGATGIVYWESEGVCFPDAHWNDIVSVLAIWWLQSVKRLEHGETQVRFEFMDGPYVVRCRRTGSLLSGEFVENKQRELIIGQWSAPLADVSREVRRFASKVLRFCDEKQISSRDITVLRSELM